MFKLSVTYYGCILMGFVTICNSNTLVNTTCGQIRGLKSYHENDVVYEFKKVPYAKPPIGYLRFRKPERLEKWINILNATQYGPSCMQYTSWDFLYVPNKDVSEDCLFLNIYVPRKLSTKSNMAVMIYIHGGSYILGQGMRYDGYYLALHGNVIVVTINYRLGIFGFLSTGNSASPGNYGIWDQRLAIQWVKENIGAFGGNPLSITLFGQSAGGFSVSLHGFIPRNKGLFQRIISESGVASSAVAVERNDIVKQYSLSVANYTGCLGNIKPVSSVIAIEVVECLRKINATYLQKAALDEYVLSNSLSLNLHLHTTPVIDGDLITDYPYRLILNKSSEAYYFFRSLDVIIGNTDGEGSVLYKSLYGQEGFILYHVLSCTGMCDIIAPALNKQLFPNISATAMCNEYKLLHCNKTNWDEQAQQEMNMYADSLFISPAIQCLRVHSDKNTQAKTYQYIFTRPPVRKTLPSWFHGAPHESELGYLFPVRSRFYFDENDRNLRNYMVTYWSQFAKTGDPNSVGMPNWPSFLPGQRYQRLDYNITSGKNLYFDRVKFWLKNIPNLVTLDKKENQNAGHSLHVTVPFLSFLILLIHSDLLS